MAPPSTSPYGGWVLDQRGGGRGVRVSAHTEAGFLVLSTWKSEVCVATVRLMPDEAAQLVANVAEALAKLATPLVEPTEQVPADGTAAPSVVVERGTLCSGPG